jgi:nucleoside-diphosphate-sugar epimerase
MGNMKTVITGSTGWLGSELTRILIQERNISTSDLNLIASTEKKLHFNKKIILTKTFKNVTKTQDVANYFDFAFLTRDKIHLIGPEKYKETNIDIINDSVNLIYRLKPKNVVLASSGAVYKTGKNWREASNFLYSDLKILQEEKIKEVCDKINSNLVVIRIFNLSGNGITKVNKFAISQFINNAVNNKEISIKSDYLVNRSYCDISQLLNTLVTAANNGYSGTLDSTGIKIELRDLAKQVIKELKSESKFDAPEVVNGSLSDDYFSESKEYSHLLNKFSGGKMFSIEQQIRRTRSGLILSRI